MLTVWIGHDPRQGDAFRVCAASLRKHASIPLDIRPLTLPLVQGLGVYPRAVAHDAQGRLVDGLTGKPMSTEFSIARFCVPFLPAAGAYALFVDCDFLWRADVAHLLGEVNPCHAVSVVQQDFRPAGPEKMDGQVQRRYARKLWSSLMVWNLHHPGNRALTLRGIACSDRDWLHALGWLPDTAIGALDRRWNAVPGAAGNAELADAFAVHYSAGLPNLPGLKDQPHAAEWRAALASTQVGY